jgi:hypothetical protein
MQSRLRRKSNLKNPVCRVVGPMTSLAEDRVANPMRRKTPITIGLLREHGNSP